MYRTDTRNILTFVGTTAIGHHEQPEAPAGFLLSYAMAVVFTNVGKLRIAEGAQPVFIVITILLPMEFNIPVCRVGEAEQA